MRHRSIVATIVLLAAVSTLMVGCKKKPPAPTPTPPATESAKPVPPPEPPPTEVKPEKFPPEPVTTAPLTDADADEWNRRKPLQTVYFAYDSAEFDEAARSAMSANADWMKANAKWKIRVEGNCDERGTIKYNLALGQRRGDSVREYLTSLGIPADRVRIVSYGEEKPASPGHDEAAWKLNRRADFWVEK
jgi:peptidoglycan-associated lipoprotein